MTEFLASHRDGVFAFIAALAVLILILVLLERRKDKKYEDRLRNALIDSRRANRIINEQSKYTKFFLEPFQSAYYIGLDDLSYQI